MRSLRWIIGAAVVLGLSAVVLAVVGARNGDGKIREQYRFETVTRGDLTQMVSANGTLNPVKLVSVGTQVSGTVKQLYVDFNDSVEEGQPLLELDDALLSAQLRQSEANLSNTTGSLTLAKANAERVRELFAKEYVSRQELDQAEQALRAAQAQQAQARAQVDRDRANLGYAIIRSPVAGIVVDRVVDVGQTVAASFQTPTLIKIAQDLAKMQINSSFAEADIGQIKTGQTAQFKVDAYPDRSFTGSVQQIRLNPVNVQNVVTYDVVVTVDNPDLILLPGMTAYVNIVVAQKKDVLLVPNNALRFRPSDLPRQERGGKGTEGAKVYVLREGELAPMVIRTGVYDAQRTEVLSGEVNEGDEVAVGEKNAQSPGASQPRRFRGF